MTELEDFANHAAKMARSKHKPECAGPHRYFQHEYVHPDPNCAGCVTDADRDLWARLAAEVDAYLTPPIDTQETLL